MLMRVCEYALVCVRACAGYSQHVSDHLCCHAHTLSPDTSASAQAVRSTPRRTSNAGMTNTVRLRMACRRRAEQARMSGLRAQRQGDSVVSRACRLSMGLHGHGGSCCTPACMCPRKDAGYTAANMSPRTTFVLRHTTARALTWSNIESTWVWLDNLSHSPRLNTRSTSTSATSGVRACWMNRG